MQRIFVVGCPRSGTTLVQAMLARHPDVLSLPETAFFEHLCGELRWRWGDGDARAPRRRLRHRLGFAHQQARVTLRSLHGRQFPLPLPLGSDRCARDFVALLDARASAAGCAAWVEKTPNHLLYIPEIERHVPDARFVHVIRPGVDVLASIADASLRYAERGAFGGGTALWMQRWNRAAEIHREHAGQPRHHFVFLDELTRDSQREWQRLCDFLRIDATVGPDNRHGRSIADLDAEPWKRDALSGLPVHTKHKAEQLFGPQALAWLRRQLVPYEEVRQSCGGRTPQAERGVSYLYR